MHTIPPKTAVTRAKSPVPVQLCEQAEPSSLWNPRPPEPQTLRGSRSHHVMSHSATSRGGRCEPSAYKGKALPPDHGTLSQVADITGEIPFLFHQSDGSRKAPTINPKNTCREGKCWLQTLRPWPWTGWCHLIRQTSQSNFEENATRLYWRGLCSTARWDRFSYHTIRNFPSSALWCM